MRVILWCLLGAALAFLPAVCKADIGDARWRSCHGPRTVRLENLGAIPQLVPVLVCVAKRGDRLTSQMYLNALHDNVEDQRKTNDRGEFLTYLATIAYAQDEIATYYSDRIADASPPRSIQPPATPLASPIPATPTPGEQVGSASPAPVASATSTSHASGNTTCCFRYGRPPYATPESSPSPTSSTSPSVDVFNVPVSEPNADQRRPSPVILDGCRIEYAGGIVFAKTGMLNVEFANEGDVTADMVRIQVRLLDGATNVRDVGMFAPGVSIKHRVRNEQGQVLTFPMFGGKRNALACSIVMVHFVDGSSWRAEDF